MARLARAVLLSVATVIALVLGLVSPASASVVVSATSQTEESAPPPGDIADVPALESDPLPPQTPTSEVGEFEIPATPPTEVAPPPPITDGPSDSVEPANRTTAGEVVDEDEFSTTVKTGDGRFKTTISREPQRARDEDGEWADISTTLDDTGDGWAVDTHPLEPEFAGAADDPDAVVLNRDGNEVSFALVGADEGTSESACR